MDTKMLLLETTPATRQSKKWKIRQQPFLIMTILGLTLFPLLCNFVFLEQDLAKVIPENAEGASLALAAGANVLSASGENVLAYVPNTMAKHNKRKAIMVLAAVPLDKRHVMSLWSELQCFTYAVQHVLIAAPIWSETIVQSILARAMEQIPQFASHQVTISAQFFENDRYDIGLWCDGMDTMKTNDYDDIVLLNDSLFALRKFNGVLDTLRSDDLRMTSLSYSATDSKGIWLESVFRAFDKQGLARFRNYSCVPATDPLFCPDEVSNERRKRCFVEHFEIEAARLFPPEKVKGVYLSDVPKDWWMEHRPYATWVVHSPYWAEVMVKEWNFPAAKVTKRDMIRNLEDPRIRNCTRGMDKDTLRSFNFSAGVRTIKKRSR